MGKTLRVLKLAVIRYPNALLVVVLASIGVRGFKHTIYFATKLVFPYVFLTWIIFIIFQVVAVGRFHYITPSLLHFLLDMWKSGGAPIWKGKEYSSENLNLTPTGDLCERCLSFIIPLKDTA